MNVGIVTTWFERGAAYVSRQYKTVLEQQCNVQIYARGGEKGVDLGPEWAGPGVTRGRESSSPFLTAIDEDDFCRWLDEQRIEVVLFNEQRWWLPILWCRQRGLKVGAYVDYYTENTVELFDVYDFLICNTKRHYGVFKWHPQCYYIPWGTDITLFKPSTVLPSSSNEITFFHSAGMNPDRKGTDLLLEAFSQLTASSRLIIHTQVDLASVLAKKVPLIKELLQNGHLEVIERTVPAPGLYHLGDIYVYPSRLDGIGLSLVEAAACGLPLIATDVPPMNEFVEVNNGKLVSVDKFIPRHDGYYWPQAVVSIQSLYESMRYYIDNKAQLSLFKAAARMTAENRLDWHKNSVELCSIIDKVKIRKGHQMQRMEILVEDFEQRRGAVPHKSVDNQGLMSKLRALAGKMAKR